MGQSQKLIIRTSLDYGKDKIDEHLKMLKKIFCFCLFRARSKNALISPFLSLRTIRQLA